MELSQSVKDKLGAAVQQWADENLPGRPAILAHAVYHDMERSLLKKQQEIDDKFPPNNG